MHVQRAAIISPSKNGGLCLENSGLDSPGLHNTGRTTGRSQFHRVHVNTLPEMVVDFEALPLHGCKHQDDRHMPELDKARVFDKNFARCKARMGPRTESSPLK